MHLRLVHKLSLLMLSFALLAVVALGGFTAWNLRQGFGEYLAAKDVQHLEQLTAGVEKLIQNEGLDVLQNRGLTIHDLLNRFSGMPFDLPDPFPWKDRGWLNPPPNGLYRPPPGGPDALPNRLSIVGLDGQTLLGRPQIDISAQVLRPVHRNGQVVAWGRMVPARVILGDQSRFLFAQYVGIVLISGVLVLLALFGAIWHSRRWVRPLIAVQSATQQLATGKFSARIPVGLGVHSVGDEIDEVVHNINQMAASLERLDSSRRRWLADISHELRTPLTVLQGDIEALCDGVRPMQHQAMVVLREEVRSLGKIVNDLHLLALSDLHPLSCHFVDFDLVECVAQCVERFQRRAQDAGLVMVFHEGRDISQRVCWDADRIHQLMANILQNSLRYTDAPGQISIRLKVSNECVHLMISDSSPSVSVQDLAHIFDPLYRCDLSRSRVQGGSGLGLSICQAIVSAHGGTIQAMPSDLGGLSIEMVLPVWPESAV